MEKRIDELLINDKFANIQQVAEILKEEVTPLARNFLLFDKEPVVRFKKVENKFIFDIEIEADRVKSFGIRLI